ncbi:hypothetical protein LTR53_003638 [Teratosphaeriaceae sp. CCFEE 6253]|nr:hypothetical protein LTR53_003638 [Teratosphaeriaceae sp. CCFEE 6253]
MAGTQNTRIRLLKTAFVTYYHVDLTKARQFLLHFGLTVAHEEADTAIYFKGYGSEPYVYIARPSETGTSYFGGAAYVVESRVELDRAISLPSSDGKISALDGPAGGEFCTLTDPCGHKVHLVHGWKEQEHDLPGLPKLTFNFENEKPRKGSFQRFTPGPAPVYRWGHYGVSYSEGQYQTMYDWYMRTLTLAPSDIVHEGEQPMVCFFHLDRGEEFTDHHSFYIKPARPGIEPAVTHAAFEIHDFDVQQLGHQFLAEKGYELCWGVGRHVLGSQVFDYWFDTSRFMVEHYADGDLVNCNTPVANVQAGRNALAIWGPPTPAIF